ncbi:polymorphic toxin type 44 domain-containing protein [Gottfriedia luciferensis]|uniref:polymorphic toxin type 44 domain-containing protein n=1 Tax=Gottfriedia luciferensis TaxID=178774 RepID=UPI000B44CCFA|nr:polymorphic toxin type 44 domain-containing protein [Gottfriedia luciferensis]
MKKKLIVSAISATALLVSMSSVSAAQKPINKIPRTFQPAAVDPGGGDITSSFASKMSANSLTLAYRAKLDSDMGTYPLGVGQYFASQVKSGGPWDYKRQYGATTQYIFNGKYVKGEDLGNIHYGYVGSVTFKASLLQSAAGAYQIYSGTSQGNWYGSYFDDPNDQYWINYGINMWNNHTLPKSAMLLDNGSPSNNNAISDNNSSNTLSPLTMMLYAEAVNKLTDAEKQQAQVEMKKISDKIKLEKGLK